MIGLRSKEGNKSCHVPFIHILFYCKLYLLFESKSTMTSAIDKYVTSESGNIVYFRLSCFYWVLVKSNVMIELKECKLIKVHDQQL